MTMRPVRTLAVAHLLGAALMTPAIVGAQSTRERIDQAIALYEAFNVEAARPILQLIISPGYTQQVSSQEKAIALKYLGASYAVLEKPDSAVQFFMGALDFDPFTDLDPTKFAASELGAFNEAKRRLFKVAIRPLAGPALVQRDSVGVRFEFITTQRSQIRIDIVNQRDTSIKETLYEGPNEGVRPISWRGVLQSGRYAPPDIYQLRIRGTPSGGSSSLTETSSLRIEHIFEPIEDTLPPFDPTRDLLPERIRSSQPWYDLAKGTALAAAAITIPLLALEKNDIAWAPHAGVTAFIGASSATISFWYRRNRPQIRANVLENTRRRTLRDNFNNAVRQRNQTRLDRTLLIVSPVTFGQ
jgi:hypothetical protein